jgi:hypothetical protein
MKRLEHGLYEMGGFLIERNNYYGGSTGEALQIGWEIRTLDNQPIDLDQFETLRAAKQYVLKHGYSIK